MTMTDTQSRILLEQDDAVTTLRLIRAVSVARGTDPFRPILTTVCIRDGVVMATDSYRLAMAKLPESWKWDGDLLIPSELVTWLHKCATETELRKIERGGMVTLALELVAGELVATFTSDAGTATSSTRIEDRQFPAVDVLIPEETVNLQAVIAFNPTFLAGLEKIRKHLGKDHETDPVKVVSATDPLKPAMFRIGDDGRELDYLLMPVRV